MLRATRMVLARELATFVAVAGGALALFDAWTWAIPRAAPGVPAPPGVAAPLTLTSPFVLDVLLVGAALAVRWLAARGWVRAPALTSVLLMLGVSAVGAVAGRWWMALGAAFVAAVVAPQILPARRAWFWIVGAAVLALAYAWLGPAEGAPGMWREGRLLAAGAAASWFAIGAGAVSLRLRRVLRARSSREASEGEQLLEAASRRISELESRLQQYEGGGERARRLADPHTQLARRMGVIRAVASAIARELESPEAALGRSALELAARRSAERARQVVRLSAGAEAREPATTLGILWPRVLELVGPALRPVHHVELDLPLTLPPVVGSAEEWAQLLAQLAENSLAAMPSGGVLRITAARSERPGIARVRVEDSGEGIAPENLSRVFDLFFTTRAGAEAAGLGLPMVRGLVEALGGEVRIASEPGALTRVEIEVPFYVRPGRVSAPGGEAPLRLPGTVLLADDDKEMRRVARRHLESVGLEVVEADGGFAAQAHFRAGPERYAAAMLDVVMPGTPVDELVAGMRELRPDFPVLLVSGYDVGPLVDTVLALGGARFLRKPFDREELVYQMRDLLAERPGS